MGISPALGGRANLEVGTSEFWRYSCFSVHKSVFLHLKALSQCLRVGSLVALWEHQGSWDLTSVPCFLSPPPRKFCLGFTAELGDSYPGNSDGVWHLEVERKPRAGCGPVGLLCHSHSHPQAGTTSPIAWLTLPWRERALATPCTSHRLSPRPWRLTYFNIH